MTADALGPLTIEKMAQSGMASYTSMIVPGVFAQTGMESCEIIQGIVQQTSPDCIITMMRLQQEVHFGLVQQFSLPIQVFVQDLVSEMQERA